MATTTTGTTSTTAVPTMTFSAPDELSDAWILIGPVVFLAFCAVTFSRHLWSPLKSVLVGEALQLKMKDRTTEGQATWKELAAQFSGTSRPHEVIRTLEQWAINVENTPDGRDLDSLLILRESQLRALDPAPTELADVLKETRMVEGGTVALREKKRSLALVAFEVIMGREVYGLDLRLTILRKSLWITTVATLLVIGLLATTKAGPVLLVGAVGGITFRAFRASTAIGVTNRPEWASLFPVVPASALAAFGGILLINLSSQMELLGPTFAVVHPEATNIVTLAAAFLLGFSERFIESLSSSAESKVIPPRSGGTSTGNEEERVEAVVLQAIAAAADAEAEAEKAKTANPAEKATAVQAAADAAELAKAAADEVKAAEMAAVEKSADNAAEVAALKAASEKAAKAAEEASAAAERAKL